MSATVRAMCSPVTKRASLTPKERAAMLVSQGGVCAECGGPGPFDGDHTTPVAMGNEEKPDRLICRRTCHKAKTRGDVRVISKTRRRALLAGQQARRARRKAEGKRPLLPTKPLEAGRGFDKTLTRGFDGKVRGRKP